MRQAGTRQSAFDAALSLSRFPALDTRSSAAAAPDA